LAGFFIGSIKRIGPGGHNSEPGPNPKRKYSS
jgi:hypothetical protein